jgi:hypothetical protein
MRHDASQLGTNAFYEFRCRHVLLTAGSHPLRDDAARAVGDVPAERVECIGALVTGADGFVADQRTSSGSARRVQQEHRSGAKGDARQQRHPVVVVHGRVSFPRFQKIRATHVPVTLELE